MYKSTYMYSFIGIKLRNFLILEKKLHSSTYLDSISVFFGVGKFRKTGPKFLFFARSDMRPPARIGRAHSANF